MRSRPLSLLVGVVAAMTGAAAGCATGDVDSSGGAGGAGTASGSTSASTVTSSVASTTSVSSTAASADASSSDASSSASTGSGPVCGDGVIEPPEQCEGTDFNGKTCASFGLSAGDLACNGFCGVVVSGCVPKESCANQQDDDQDDLTDCDDDECAAVAGCIDSCASPLALNIPAFEFSDLTGRPDTVTLPCSAGGREIVYSFIAPNTADVSVELFFADFDAAVSVRTACGDAATEIVCRNENSGSSSTESFSFPVLAGAKYFLVIEAANGGTGSFSFEVEEIQPEFWCEDFQDNDFDGFLDCDDPSDCKGTSSSCSPGTGEVGTPCGWPGECAANQGDPICLTGQLGFISGYCSEFCDLASNDCPGDAQCADLGLSVHGVCLDGCVTTVDCQPGYVCLDEGLPTKVCDRPPEVQCNDNDDNDIDGFVDCEDVVGCATSPACVPGPGAPGAPCQLHNECASQSTDPFCVDQFNFGWPGGYCSEFCTLGGTDCPSGSVCSDAVKPSQSSSPNGVCLHTCATQTDCRPGYTCGLDGANHMVCLL